MATYAQTKDSKIASTCIPQIDTIDNQQVFNILDKAPEYPGGKEAMDLYFQRNIEHSIDYYDWKLAIFITFIVDTTGNIRNSCVYRTHNSNGELTALEKEALRIVNIMPQWTPGEKQGKKVYSRYTVQIHMWWK